MASRDVAFSWVLFAMREFLEEEETRIQVLRHFIGDNPNVVFGKTFTANPKIETYEEFTSKLKNYLLHITSPQFKEKNVLFTVTMFGYSETHYHSFILQNEYDILWSIDPSLDLPLKRQLYNDAATNMVRFLLNEIVDENPTLYSSHFDFSYVPTTHACQVVKSDVFCQSWSLYLQIQTILMILKNEFYYEKSEPVFDASKKRLRNEILPYEHFFIKHKTIYYNRSGQGYINIPFSQKEKYEILLKFYKDLILYVPNFCNNFKLMYRHRITNIHEFIKNPTELFKKSLMLVDPCDMLLKALWKDLE